MPEDTECVHGMVERSWCHICQHPDQYKVKEARKPKPRRRVVQRAPKDPMLVLVEQIASGRVCPFCLTDRKPDGRAAIGCLCNRERMNDWQVQDSMDFAADLSATGIMTPQEAYHSAFSGIRRSDRRAGLEGESIGEHAAELRQYVADLPTPNWHQPRTNEASFLPV